MDKISFFDVTDRYFFTFTINLFFKPKIITL